MVIRADGSVLIRVSDSVLAEADELARQRNSGHASDEQFEADYHGLDIHYWGAIAELAWELVTGWPVDRKKRPGGDKGVDFENEGYTYQIKVRNPARFKDPDLLCRVDKAIADVYILAEIDPDTPNRVTFVGWCKKDKLKKQTISINGKGERYVCKRYNLKPIPRKILDKKYGAVR